MSDLMLRKQILDELEFLPHIDAAAIGVTVQDGVVVLSGHVRTFAEKNAAEYAVKSVKGVRAVAEEIEVRVPSDLNMDDDLIATRCLDLIRWNAAVPDEHVQIKVQQGWVTIEGEVEWQYQREAAHKALLHLAGIAGINNLLVVKPKASAEHIKMLITAALERSVVTDTRRIRITVDGGHVRLDGYVHHWLERKATERTAWSVPGVKEVENRLFID